jgi:lipopolysaccharide export system protein LptA
LATTLLPPVADDWSALGGYNQKTTSCKIRAFMKYPQFLFVVVCAATAFAMCSARAETPDRDMPMNAESDALRYDDLKQTSVFTGKVVITKGTTIIRGERVDVEQDPEGYQKATVLAAPGKLAFYRKKREGLDEFIEGEGERIDYDSRTDVVKFIRQAVLRRYKGAVLADESTGSQINYDNVTDVFTVDGGPQNRSLTNPTGRVRSLLSPRNAVPGAAAPVAPAAATGPTPNLKSSPALGAGDKK